MMRIVQGLIKLILIVTPLLVMAIGGGMLWLSRSQAPLDGQMECPDWAQT
jgi:penicillin amidase